MTPAELITRKLKTAIENAGATVPVYSLLLEALEGEKHETPSSGIALNVHVSGQLDEPLPHYTFAATASLTVSIDDDKGGRLFVENYDVLWAVFDTAARGDNCVAFGDEADELDEGAAHVFAVDGFQITDGTEPDYQQDENGGSWTTTFAATITGRAN